MPDRPHLIPRGPRKSTPPLPSPAALPPLPKLPVAALADEIASGLAETRRLIIEAPTGSGKSTLVPRILLASQVAQEQPGGQIIVLQPRRLAARMLAARVASELGEKPGGLVGYQIRLDNVSSERTRILFVTEGILLRRMLSDPDLRGVSALIFDEFHERHLHTDLALARALDIQEAARPDLGIVVMSATLDSSRLAAYLHPARLVRSEGRAYPVEITHIKRETGEPVWDLAAREAVRLVQTGGAESGHILVFMPGAYEIQRTISALRAEPALAGRPVFALHGELPPDRQDEAVAPSREPKIIAATNVAETSLTIEGVTAVIDSGLARIAAHDPHRGINTLLVEKISRASADQRAGRAGRTAPGRCVRLWTVQDHAGRRLSDEPEICRLDLAEAVLLLKSAGVRDLAAFRWMDPPEPAALDRATQLLIALGALDPEGQTLTPVGREMLRYPVHPRYGRMFIEAEKTGCLRPVALAAALTQTRSILLKTSDRRILERREELLETGASSDFEVLFRAFSFAAKSNFHPGRCADLGIHAAQCRQAAALAGQLARIAGCREDDDAPPAPEGALARCMLAAFPDHVAVRLDGGTLRCALTGGRRGTLSRESAARSASLLVAAEVREIDARDRLQVLLSLAAGITLEDLREVHPSAVTETRRTYWEPALRRVVSQDVVLYHDLAVQTGRLSEPAPQDAARVLAEQIVNGSVKLAGWDNSVEEWIQRLNWLCQTMPELGLTPITDADRASLIEQLCYGAASERELAAAPVKETVHGWLSAAQRGLVDKFAPERLTLPSGRRVRILYNEPGTTSPAIMATIQDLYGVERDLRIAGGQVPLLIRVLAPNRRPVQATTSLETFWKESYPALKAELKRRYPKHEWR